MKSLSSHMKSIHPAGTIEFFARSRQLIAEGKDIISLSVGELDEPTFEPAALAGIEAIKAGHTRYTLNSGLQELRDQIAIRMSKTNNITYHADQVLVSTGAKQAIFNLLFALCNAGDEVIVFAPYYPSYPEQVKMTGATPIIVETHADESFQIDYERLDHACTENTKAIIINSPNNPSGVIYNRASLEAVAKVAQKFDCWIISDEIYDSIVFEPNEYHFLTDLDPALSERTIRVNGFSKSFAMTGWRLGYCAGPKAVIETAALVQSQITNNANTVAQYAGLAALQHGDSIGPQLIDSLKAKHDIAFSSLQAIDGLTCQKALGAFYLFPDLSKTVATVPNLTVQQLAFDLLDKYHVAIVPGEAFGANSHIRVSFAPGEDRLEEGLARLTRGLCSITQK